METSKKIKEAIASKGLNIRQVSNEIGCTREHLYKCLRENKFTKSKLILLELLLDENFGSKDM